MLSNLLSCPWISSPSCSQPINMQAHPNLSLHPSASLQVISPGPWAVQTTPITPGQTPIGSHQSPTRALGHPSPPYCLGLVPTLSGHLGIHPAHDRANTHEQTPPVYML